MQKKGFWSKEKLAHLFHMYNLESVEADFDRGANILPPAYKKADLPSCIPRHLATEEQEDLLGPFEKLKELFDERIGLMPEEPYSLKTQNLYMQDLFLYHRNTSSLWKMKWTASSTLEYYEKLMIRNGQHPHFGIHKKDNTIHFYVRLYRSQQTTCETSFSFSKHSRDNL